MKVHAVHALRWRVNFDAPALKELYYAPRNEPNVHKEQKQDNSEGWHGTELSVTIEGNFAGAYK